MLRRSVRPVIGANAVSFRELVRLLQANGFRLVREKGSVRYYGRDGWLRLVRVDYHGSKQIPTGRCMLF